MGTPQEYLKFEVSAPDANSLSTTLIMSNEDVLVSSFSGYFYNSDGEFLSHEGDSDKVFLATKYDKKSKTVDKKTVGTFIYEEVTDLDIIHSDFCYIAYVVKNESGQTDITELKCIAYTSYNRATKAKKTWKGLLGTTYSSVPNKQEMSDNLTDNKSKLTRKALIAVLNNESDITDGAEYWDGTDFIAWGKDEQTPYNKKGQNKFKEYKFIEIPKDIYDTYLAANGTSARYTDKENHVEGNDSGTHEHITEKVKVKGEEIEKKYIKYSIPEAVFLDDTNWTSGSFYYATGVNTTNGISATIAAGKSIFWKPTSSRLTSETIK